MNICKIFLMLFVVFAFGTLKAEDKKEIKGKHVVFFSRKVCVNCPQVYNFLEKYKINYKKIIFAEQGETNRDERNKIFREFNVDNVPYLVIYEGDKEISRIQGFNENYLKQILDLKD